MNAVIIIPSISQIAGFPLKGFDYFVPTWSPAQGIYISRSFSVQVNRFRILFFPQVKTDNAFVLCFIFLPARAVHGYGESGLSFYL